MTGLIIRCILGAGLFAISYYHWPILMRVQAGDGFWALAPDARAYFAIAHASASRFAAVPSGSPSPTYVAVLAFWLRAAGPTVLWGVLFNVFCYFVAAFALVAAAGRGAGRGLLLIVVFLTFSPALVLTGTQALKDNFFMTLVVLGGIGVWLVLRFSRRSLAERPYALSIGIVLASVAIAAIGGIRAYYAVFMWASAAAALATSWWLHKSGRFSFFMFGALVLAVLWGAFIEGSAAYYQYYGGLITKITGVEIPILSGSGWRNDRSVAVGGANFGEVATTLESLREGFVGSGGATNLFRVRRGIGAVRVRDVAIDVGVGLAAVYVPISILRAVSLVTFDGGRGFLAVTDMDTIFLDMTVIAVFMTLWRSPVAVRRNLPVAVCFGVLTLISAAVIVYVVTNFGTLFRLRLMIVAPTWMALLTLSDDSSSAVADEVTT